MMARTEEMCQLELGKQICNLENIYSRIRTILRFEFGDENYNNDSMKKTVKKIWRFYYTAYDNRRVRDKRMKFSPAKQARRRKSILNSTLTSNDPLFSSLEVPVVVKLERVFGYDESTSKTWSLSSGRRSRYDVAGRVRLYENLVMDCCENLNNDEKEKDEIVWTLDLSLCRLILDEDNLTMRIYNHLGPGNEILDLRFGGEKARKDWKIWLEAIGSNAANRPRISLAKNSPFERIISELEKQDRKYQVRTTLPNNTENELDSGLLQRVKRHDRAALERNLLVTDLLVESVLIQRRTQNRRAFSNPSVLDFQERRKIRLSESVVFYDHAPTVFDTIRRSFGVSDEMYLKSLSEPLEGGGTGDGASGMLFFHTADWKYVVKQVKKAEKDVLHKMLENYFLHLLKNPDTLLCRFYGLLEIESGPFKGILIVMNNVSHSNIIRDKAPAMIKFDLKGSSRGRVVKEEAVLKGR